MDITITIDAEFLLEKLDLEMLGPEEIYVYEIRKEGQHPTIKIRLLDCNP